MMKCHQREVKGPASLGITTRMGTSRLVVSLIIILIINTCPMDAFAEGLIIVVQPTDIADCKGNTVTFKITIADAAGTVHYCWQQKWPGEPGFTDIVPAETTDQLKVSNIGTGTSPPDGTQFRVSVSDDTGTYYSEAATLTVNRIVGIAPIGKAGYTLCAGSNITLTTLTDGLEPLGYQWIKHEGPGIWYDIPGATSPSFSILDANWEDAGEYKPRVIFPATESGTCIETSTIVRTVTLNIPEPGTIGSDQEIPSGTTPDPLLSLIEAIGPQEAILSYQWEESTDEGNTWTEISGITTPDYAFPEPIHTTTHYRRTAVSVLNEVSCSATTDSVTISVRDHLTISKAMITNSMKPGDEIIYQINYANRNTIGTAQNVKIIDYLPHSDKFTFVSASNDGVFDESTDRVTWNLGSVPPSTSGVVKITGIAGRSGWTSFAPGAYYLSEGSSQITLTNDASIENLTNEPIFIDDPVENEITQFCGVVLEPANRIGYIDAEANSFLNYVVTLGNSGNITDQFHLNLEANIPPGQIKLNHSLLNLSDEAISETGWMAPGEELVLILRVENDQGALLNQSSYARIIASSAVCGQVGEATIITTSYQGNPGSSCDLAILKSGLASATVGTPFSYTLTIQNLAGSAESFSFYDQIPESVSFVSATCENPDVLLYHSAGELIGIYPKDFNNNDIPITITVTVSPFCAASPAFTSCATVSTPTAEQSLENNVSFLTQTVNSNISAPGFDPVASVCSGSATILTATGADAGYSYKWYDAETGGTLLVTGNSYATPPLMNSAVFYVTIYNQAEPACESSRTKIEISVDPLPVTSPIFHK